MKHVWQLALLASLAGASVAAQTPAAPAAGDPLTTALKRQFEGVARNVKEAAEKMPADKFGFQPTKEQKTFAAQIGHVSNTHYMLCSRLKGEQNPNKEDFEKVAAKDAVVKGITGANEYCASVLSAANDKWMMELAAGMGGQQVPRAAIIAGNTSHSNEIYGTVVTYLRLNNIVPPSTERSQAPRKPTQ